MLRDLERQRKTGRLDAFEMWCWRQMEKIKWIAIKSNEEKRVRKEKQK